MASERQIACGAEQDDPQLFFRMSSYVLACSLDALILAAGLRDIVLCCQQTLSAGSAKRPSGVSLRNGADTDRARITGSNCRTYAVCDHRHISRDRLERTPPRPALPICGRKMRQRLLHTRCHNNNKRFTFKYLQLVAVTSLRALKADFKVATFISIK